MHICLARLKNNSGFFDSHDLRFSPGFNLVVGRNGSGKTVLLNALAQQIQGDPHRSTRTMPEASSPPNPTTTLTVHHRLSGQELFSLAQSSRIDQLAIPIPSGVHEGSLDSLLASFFGREELELRMQWQAAENNGLGKAPVTTSALVGLEHRPDSNNPGHVRMALYRLTADRTRYEFTSPALGTLSDSDSFLELAARCRTRVYRFDAERLRRGRGHYGTSKHLAPDASNLPEVLQNLQADKHRYNEYLALVGAVLPEVRDIVVVPLGREEQEIRVSSLPPRSRRSDLAVPLLRTGSGVAQVLAMLYVVVSTESPHVILIDEPNSFLHPQASRTLIKILKGFPQHQYVIATHSPEVIAAIGTAPTTLIEWTDEESTATQYDRGDSRTASAALELVGARLADVFGYDRVIWCEGPSDALSLSMILTSFFPTHTGTVIVPVHATSAFDKRRRAETIDVYRQLSKASALVPPTLGFLFDAEDRTESERVDLERLRDVRIRFLPRRMIENFLLNDSVVATVLRSLDQQSAELPTADIREWLDANVAHARYARGEITPEVLQSDPIKWTHGKRLLNDAFVHFSGGRHSYVNTRDVAPLTREVLREDRNGLRPIALLLGELIGADPEN